MDYEELLRLLRDDKTVRLCQHRYSRLLFGNFTVRFRYREALTLLILNDRGIVEVSIETGGWFSRVSVPLPYAVGDFLQPPAREKQYGFHSVGEAYAFLQSSRGALNAIIREKKLRGIVRRWKNQFGWG